MGYKITVASLIYIYIYIFQIIWASTIAHYNPYAYIQTTRPEQLRLIREYQKFVSSWY